MSLRLQRSDWFWADLERQVDWYREEAGEEVADRFITTVETTLDALTRQPGRGRTRFAHWPELARIRSFRITATAVCRLREMLTLAKRTALEKLGPTKALRHILRAYAMADA